MSTRRAARLAWSLWALSLVLAALSLLLVIGNAPSEDSWDDGLYVLPFLAFSMVGTLVAARRPENPIGWIFCAIAVSNLASTFAHQYSVYALVARPGSLPAGAGMAWLVSWIGAPGTFLLVTFAPLLFPTGRLPSRHWRPVAWLAAVWIAVATAFAMLRPIPPNPRYPAVVSPIGLSETMSEWLGMLVALPVVVIAMACLASLVVRFRHARGEERQQLKWFAYAGALLLIAVTTGGLAVPFLLLQDNWFAQVMTVPTFPYTAVITAFPVAAGIAILKYHLYDLDRIIRGTLVYGVLTASLGLAYWGGVVLLQALLRPLTQGSDVAIAGSTLAVAALFQPARRRIQVSVDRRFYRSKYDTARILETFNTRLQQEIELDSITADLLAVVRETMQPARVSLWLRPPAGKA
jgi:hypothetical protein